MGSLLLEILAQSSIVISWSPFSLVYPLYASIRAIETDEESSYQQCLRYWVLFSIATIFECIFAKLLVWFSFWPYMKGIAAAVLAVPSFAGASYVYTHLIRPHIAEDSSSHDKLPIQDAKGCLQFELNEILGIDYRNDGDELEKLATDRVKLQLELVMERDGSMLVENRVYNEFIHSNIQIMGESEATYSVTRNILSHPVNITQVQREWSCPLCLISTTSENCLRKHLQGKKHEMKEWELKQKTITESKGANILSTRKRTKNIVENFNQITWDNYKKLSVFINPAGRSSRWSVWIKPELGWIKLNTDGSIDGENSAFGGVLRDDQGNPLCAYIAKAPGDDIFLAELWAIWRGLVLALGLGINAIWVESDSMSVVKTINEEQGYGLKASGCLKHIWMLLKKFEKHLVSHSWRETNRAADFLSKMKILETDKVLWPCDFPASLIKIIGEDAQGREYCRR